MSLRYIGNDPVNHNGEEIQVIRHFSNEKDERIEFDYKGNRVYLFFDREKYMYYNMAQKICNVIDKIGFKGYEEFRSKFEAKEGIEDNYIILNDDVYKTTVTKIPFGDLYHYSMFIQMKDDTLIDGRPFFNENGMKIEHKDEYNYNKTFDNIRSRVSNYFKEKNVFPKEEYLVKEKTEKYKEIISWFNENNI